MQWKHPLVYSLTWEEKIVFFSTWRKRPNNFSIDSSDIRKLNFPIAFNFTGLQVTRQKRNKSYMQQLLIKKFVTEFSKYSNYGIINTAKQYWYIQILRPEFVHSKRFQGLHQNSDPKPCLFRHAYLVTCMPLPFQCSVNLLFTCVVFLKTTNQAMHRYLSVIF